MARRYTNGKLYGSGTFFKTFKEKQTFHKPRASHRAGVLLEPKHFL